MSVERPRCYSLAIELTSHCNQKCSYCYNDWRADNGRSIGALPSATLLALVDRILGEVEFDHVTLTGGEPLARADFFEVMEVLRQHKVPAFIISNGGLIEQSVARRLAAHDLRGIQITLNAPEAQHHDDVVGGRHFDATLVGIRELRRHDVPVMGSVVVTRRNAGHLGEILALWRSLDVRSVALSRFSPAGYAATHVAELLPSRSDMIAALDVAESFAAAGMDLQVTLPIPPCVIDHADYPHIHFGSCPIGTEMQEFTLGPQGELRACTLHREVLGDVKTRSLAELVQLPVHAAYRDVTPEFCAPCPHQRECIGGCGAAAASILSDPRGLDPFVAQHVDDAFAQRLSRERKRLPVMT